MNTRTRASRYSRAQVAIHWLTVVLIGVNYLMNDGISRAYKAFLRDRPIEADSTVQLHVLVGQILLGLVALRLILRLWLGAPEAASTGKPILDLAAKLVHLALYALLFAVPVTGMMTWFGGFRLGETHELAVNLLIATAFIHAAAGLYHHFVLKDGLLRRMT